MNVFILIFQSIITPLILTIIIELGVLKLVQTLFRGYNFQYLLLSIIVINMVTNPLFNVLSSILDPLRQLFLLEIGFEILIIGIEAGVLYFIYKKDFNKFLFLSIIINLISYGVGLILFTPSWI